jgi:hypothetical protein
LQIMGCAPDQTMDSMYRSLEETLDLIILIFSADPQYSYQKKEFKSKGESRGGRGCRS